MRLSIVLTCAFCSVVLAMGAAINLGGLMTSGNSDVKQLDAGFGLTGNPSSSLETGFTATASYGSQDEEAYLEKYLSQGTLKYSFTANDYAASRLYWTRDEFSGVSREYGATAGYGRNLFTQGDFTASLEAGAGYLSRENTLEDELATSTWYGGARMAWTISDSWQLTEIARFTGDFQDSGNYSLENVAEASSSITGNLSFVMGYDITYHNLPPVEGNEKTDTALRVQLRLDV